MELNITRFFTDAAPRDYSASAAELGPDAGRITWAHACEDSPDYAAELLPDADSRESWRDYVGTWGAWNATERAAWSDAELGALLLQSIAGDMRECGIGPDSTAADWARYHADAEDGRVSGRIWRDDSGQVFYYVGE